MVIRSGVQSIIYRIILHQILVMKPSHSVVILSFSMPIGFYIRTIRTQRLSPLANKDKK